MLSGTVSVVGSVLYCFVLVSSGAGSPLLVYCTGGCVCSVISATCARPVLFSRVVFVTYWDLGLGIFDSR